MPLNLEIIRATDFVRVGPEGHFDLPASKAALAVLAAACHKRAIQNALIDLRELRPGPKPVFSRADLVELVNIFPVVGFTPGLHLAIVYHSDPHKRARLFAFLSNLVGWKVRAFGDYNEALLWFSREEAAEAEKAAERESVPIPIRQSDSDVPIQKVEILKQSKSRKKGKKKPGSVKHK